MFSAIAAAVGCADASVAASVGCLAFVLYVAAILLIKLLFMLLLSSWQ